MLICHHVGMKTHADIIKLWPSLAEFCRDIGVSYPTGQAMRNRSSIRATHWPRLIEAAHRRGFTTVNLEMLAQAQARQSRARRRARQKKASHAVEVAA